jgi:hypothetical protein
MNTRRWIATLIAFALAVAVAAIGFAGAASAKAPVTVTTHSYVNGSGASKHATVGALPKKYRALVKRAFARTRSLQATGGSQTCLGGTKESDTAAMQTCTVTSSSGACIQISTDPGATQTCTFMQGPGRTNLAIVLQVIVQRDSSPSGSQTGSQTVNTTQQNTTKPNLSFVVQLLKQSLGRGAFDPDNEQAGESSIESTAEAQGALPNFSPLIATLQSSEPLTEGDETPSTTIPPATVSQTQQSQQTINICQGGAVSCFSPAEMLANNLSSVYQSLRQRERWANAGSISQFQNHNVGSCSGSGGLSNQCAIVDQNTTANPNGGKNFSGLAELYRQFQGAANATTADQEQDPNFHQVAHDHDIRQTSSGADPAGPAVNTALTTQWGRQAQRVSNIAGLITQIQDPVGKKGFLSFQVGSENDVWRGAELETQLQTTNGMFTAPQFGSQEELVTYDGDATGTIHARQTAVQNGNSKSNACDTSHCHIQVDCTGATVGEGGPSPGMCVAGPSQEGGEIGLRIR